MTSITLYVDVPKRDDIFGPRKEGVYFPMLININEGERTGVCMSINIIAGVLCRRVPEKTASAFRFVALLTSVLLGVLAYSCLFSGMVSAQSTYGSFVGTVHDPSGAAVAGCKITVTNQGNGAVRSVLTDNTGSYTVVNLEPGIYGIVMESSGFQRFDFTNLELRSRQTFRADGNLALATQVGQVEVVEKGAPITTDVSNIAETKTGGELIDLPDSVVQRSTGSTSAFGTLTVQPGVQIDNNGDISVAGGQPGMVEMSVDGISTLDPSNSGPAPELFPSNNSIAEIRISEVGNSAEYGGVSDISTTTKSGTNAFHGGVFENHQNSAVDARNPFSITKPKLIMNDFGGFLGGPIKKDRTFFFIAYEGLRLPFQTVLDQSVPTLALRSGDLSAYPAGTVYNPATGLPFPGNQIPQGSISQISLNALKYLFPLPNTPNVNTNSLVNNYVVNYPTPISNNQGDVRIDQKINDSQSFFGRLSYKQRLVSFAPGGSALVGPLTDPDKDVSLSGAYDYIISPRVVNELRAGWTGHWYSQSLGVSAPTLAQEVGLTLPQPAPTDFGATPQFNISGFQPTGGDTGFRSDGTTFQIIDNVIMTKSQHTIKVGGDFRRVAAHFGSVFEFDRLGQYFYNGSLISSTYPNNSNNNNQFADFLLGIPDASEIATVTNDTTNGNSRSYAFYGQDNWQISPHFTLNYGLRWEYHPMFIDTRGNIGNFDPNIGTIGAVIVPDNGLNNVNPLWAGSIAPTPVMTASQVGLPNGLRHSSLADFAPRIGFAWRVTDDGKTVLRGGYGKYIVNLLGAVLGGGEATESSYVGLFNNQITNGKPLYSFPNPFPSNLAVPGAQNFEQAYLINYKDPYVQQWNLTFERDLGFQTALRISYDGNHTSNQGVTRNLNAVQSNTIGFNQANTPFPIWNVIAQFTNQGVSNYSALTVSAKKRFSKGLTFEASYVFAKNLSDVGGNDPYGFQYQSGGFISDAYNARVDYGNVEFTRRHRFLTTFVYKLPFGETQYKAANQVIGGWELAGVLMFQTGPFLTVTALTDPLGNNFDNQGGPERADRVPRVPLYQNQGIAQWVNPAAFTTPPNNVDRNGTAAVGDVVGPGTQAVSLSLYRNFKITEKVNLRAGVAATNVLNHPNYGLPNLLLGTPGFGAIGNVQTTEGSGPRLFELSGRITF